VLGERGRGFLADGIPMKGTIHIIGIGPITGPRGGLGAGSGSDTIGTLGEGELDIIWSSEKR